MTGRAEQRACPKRPTCWGRSQSRRPAGCAPPCRPCGCTTGCWTCSGPACAAGRRQEEEKEGRWRPGCRSASKGAVKRSRRHTRFMKVHCIVSTHDTCIRILDGMCTRCSPPLHHADYGQCTGKVPHTFLCSVGFGSVGSANSVSRMFYKLSSDAQTCYFTPPFKKFRIDKETAPAIAMCYKAWAAPYKTQSWPERCERPSPASLSYLELAACCQTLHVYKSQHRAAKGIDC